MTTVATPTENDDTPANTHGVAMGYYDAAPSGAINVALPVF